MATVTELKNPFVGLRAFEEDEDYLFFGRSAEINDLLKKFSNSRFLAVIGSSGSGKSSLVKSGLLPAIYSGFLSVGHNWRVAVMRPGNDPIGNLSKELAKERVLYENVESSGIPFEPIIESTLRRSGNGLTLVYKEAHLAETENLLIVVDQFEELFRFSKYEKQSNQGVSDSLNFINLLLTATQQAECPVYVLLTMRSDFLGDCSQFRGLPEAINEGQYLVPRMTRDEVKEAITGPIAVGGAKISQRLLTRLLNDVGNDIDQLPILQHAMLRTWNAWDERNKPDEPIDIEDYDKIGGMKEALSVHANEIYDELKTEERKKYCELMFKALTDKAADVRGTRRPRSVTDLSILVAAPTMEVISIAENFRKPGRTFLMPPPNVTLNESSIIDISHESLMRVWDKLKEWTEEEAINAEVYKRLVEDAKREATGEASLWINPELGIGLNWRKKFNDNEGFIKIWAKSFNSDPRQALDFLKRSEEHAKAEHDKKVARAKRRKITAIALILLFAILAGISYIYKIRADDATKKVKIALNSAKAARDMALHSDTLAQIEKAKAIIAKNAAIAASDSAHTSDSLAQIAKTKAIEAERKAKIDRDLAVIAKNQADSQKIISDSLAKNSAAAKYQKLIRNFTTDEDVIKKNTELSYKLVAYCNHLDTLEKLKVEGANKINFELYDKLYYCLKSKGKENNPVQLGNNTDRRFATDTLDIVKAFINRYPSGNIVSITVDQTDKAVVYSTPDNDLWMCHYNEATKSIVDSLRIPMGAQVTAIGYFAERDIIYFGLKTGETGYINFKTDGKNQPVFRNDLGSKISAVQLFGKGNYYYFLATSYMGIAVVYEIGNLDNYERDYLVPNKKLHGIELPEYYGVINKAKFIGADSIILVTGKGAYLWNPFTDQLLKKLKEIRVNDESLNDKALKIQNTPDCKFY